MFLRVAAIAGLCALLAACQTTQKSKSFAEEERRAQVAVSTKCITTRTRGGFEVSRAPIQSDLTLRSATYDRDGWVRAVTAQGGYSAISYYNLYTGQVYCNQKLWEASGKRFEATLAKTPWASSRRLARMFIFEEDQVKERDILLKLDDEVIFEGKATVKRASNTATFILPVAERYRPCSGKMTYEGGNWGNFELVCNSGSGGGLLKGMFLTRHDHMVEGRAEDKNGRAVWLEVSTDRTRRR